MLEELDGHGHDAPPQTSGTVSTAASSSSNGTTSVRMAPGPGHELDHRPW